LPAFFNVSYSTLCIEPNNIWEREAITYGKGTTVVFRPVVGPNYLPNQWFLRAFSTREHKADTTFIIGVKNAWSHTFSSPFIVTIFD
jgi:hypothetical protein